MVVDGGRGLGCRVTRDEQGYLGEVRLNEF